MADSIPEMIRRRPRPTYRKWHGENVWVDSRGVARVWKEDGKWYNGRDRRWERGDVPEAYRYFYWYYVFLFNRQKYSRATLHELGEIHRDFAAKLRFAVQPGRKTQFRVHRSALKTTYISIGHAIYMICEHPDVARQGIFWSALDEELAGMIYDTVIEELTENPKIIKFYGYLVDVDKSTEPGRAKKRKFTNAVSYLRYQQAGERPALRCMPFREIKITGWHPALVYLDDIEEEPMTASVKAKFVKNFAKRIIPAVEDRGAIIISCTIKGFDPDTDIYIYLESRGNWRVHVYPAVVDANGKPAFPGANDVDWCYEKVPLVDANGKPVLDSMGRPEHDKVMVVRGIRHRDRYRVVFPEKFTLDELWRLYIATPDEDSFFSEYLLIPCNPEGKFFRKERVRPMENMPFPFYHDLESFWEWVQKYRAALNIYLFIDPGGESGHGVSFVVMLYHGGVWYVLDLLVLHQDLPECAEALYKLMSRWDVDLWGVEGNFQQKQFFGRGLYRELCRYYDRVKADTGIALDPKYLRPPMAVQNTTNKIQRIRAGMTKMLGKEGMPYTFFVNTNAQSYQRFYYELISFGSTIRSSEKHEFDLLDAIVSCDLHMIGMPSGVTSGVVGGSRITKNRYLVGTA